MLCASSALAGLLPIESQTGVLRMGSEYESGTTETGTGVLLKIPVAGGKPRHVVATCAHLTGGRTSGSPARPSGR